MVVTYRDVTMKAAKRYQEDFLMFVYVCCCICGCQVDSTGRKRTAQPLDPGMIPIDLTISQAVDSITYNPQELEVYGIGFTQFTLW